MTPEPDQVETDQLAAFCGLAQELGFLDPAQAGRLKSRCKQYRLQGMAMGPEAVAKDLGLLAQPQVNRIVAEIRARRRRALLPGATGLPLPFKLGPFVLQRHLGGQMSCVYQALDESSKRRVAVKLLSDETKQDRELVERFKREAVMLRALDHPNLVACEGAGCVQGRFYIAMEYVEGEPLETVLASRIKLEAAAALIVAHELASALTHLHAKGLIHRDIKPSNVILGQDGRARLLDLGLGKFTGRQSDLTAEGMAVGTPHYIAPEQATGSKQIDHRADLYSLGALLFHMLCGRPPYQSTESFAVMRMHVSDPVPDPLRFTAGLSLPVRQLVMKLLQKEPVRRIQSAEELERALRGLLGSGRQAAST